MQKSDLTESGPDTAPVSGLRERQRLESLKQIHTAARELVEANGFVETTVAAIAERAGVSRRTFFNYYPTKEDAVLGIAATMIPPDALDDYLGRNDNDDRLGRIVVLLARTTLNLRQSGATRDELHHLVKQYPELRERLHQRFQEVQEHVSELALKKLEEGGENSADAQALVEVLIVLAGAALKFSFRKNPEIFDNPTREAFQPTIRAFQTALKEVQ